jgi:hypothetical protein
MIRTIINFFPSLKKKETCDISLLSVYLCAPLESLKVDLAEPEERGTARNGIGKQVAEANR